MVCASKNKFDISINVFCRVSSVRAFLTLLSSGEVEIVGEEEKEEFNSLIRTLGICEGKVTMSQKIAVPNPDELNMDLDCDEALRDAVEDDDWDEEQEEDGFELCQPVTDASGAEKQQQVEWRLPRAATDLAKALKINRNEKIALLRDIAKRTPHGRIACPLCPAKDFRDMSRLLRHLCSTSHFLHKVEALRRKELRDFLQLGTPECPICGMQLVARNRNSLIRHFGSSHGDAIDLALEAAEKAKRVQSNHSPARNSGPIAPASPAPHLASQTPSSSKPVATAPPPCAHDPATPPAAQTSPAPPPNPDTLATPPPPRPPAPHRAAQTLAPAHFPPPGLLPPAPHPHPAPAHCTPSDPPPPFVPATPAPRPHTSAPPPATQTPASVPPPPPPPPPPFRRLVPAAAAADPNFPAPRYPNTCLLPIAPPPSNLPHPTPSNELAPPASTPNASSSRCAFVPGPRPRWTLNGRTFNTFRVTQTTSNRPSVTMKREKWAAIKIGRYE